MGYHLAGYKVVGVDIKPQPNYPFEFHQADALIFPLDGFDLIHASPPCQFHTQMRASWRSRYPNDGHFDSLSPTIARLRPLEMPWVIENVIGAGSLMKGAFMLHGAMFGLRVDRARLFLANRMIFVPQRCRRTPQPVGVYDSRPRGKTHFRTRTDMRTGKKSAMRIARTLEEAQDAMGMDWADWHGTKEAIPPAYSRYIGEQMMPHVLRAMAQKGAA